MGWNYVCLGMKGGYGRALQTVPGGGRRSGRRTVSRGQQALGRPEGEALGGWWRGWLFRNPQGSSGQGRLDPTVQAQAGQNSQVLGRLFKREALS